IVEIKGRQVENLRKHQRYDHEGDAARPQRKQPDRDGKAQSREKPGRESRDDAEAKVLDRQPGAVESGGKEHRMAQTQESGIADEHVVADGIAGEHHDASKIGVVIGRQHELRGEQQGDHGEMQKHRTPRLCRSHRPLAPKRPAGRNTSTSATSNVAMILPNVAEKKTEITPSPRPIRKAATSVPRRLPRPPMMTTMKESR